MAEKKKIAYKNKGKKYPNANIYQHNPNSLYGDIAFTPPASDINLYLDKLNQSSKHNLDFYKYAFNDPQNEGKFIMGAIGHPKSGLEIQGGGFVPYDAIQSKYFKGDYFGGIKKKLNPNLSIGVTGNVGIGGYPNREGKFIMNKPKVNPGVNLKWTFQDGGALQQKYGGNIFKYGENISTMGYRDDSPYKNAPFLDIYAPTGEIDMSNTGTPLLANGQYLAPYSGKHQMGTTQVREVPTTFAYGGPPDKVDPKEILKYLKNKGVSKNHALGIINNILYESNFNSGIPGDGGTSIGLFQHHADRKNDLLNYIGGKKNLSNWKKQIDFALSEKLSQQYLAQNFLSPEEASMWFTGLWEKPQDKQQKTIKRLQGLKHFIATGEWDINAKGYNIPTSLHKYNSTLFPAKTSQPSKYLKGLDKNMLAFYNELATIFPNIELTSGKRSSSQKIGKNYKGSHHNTGNAIDISKKHGDIYAWLMNTSEGLNLLNKYKLGILDETNPKEMEKTGATGPHFHIGTDPGLYKNTQNRIKNINNLTFMYAYNKNANTQYNNTPKSNSAPRPNIVFKPKAKIPKPVFVSGLNRARTTAPIFQNEHIKLKAQNPNIKKLNTDINFINQDYKGYSNIGQPSQLSRSIFTQSKFK